MGRERRACCGLTFLGSPKGSDTLQSEVGAVQCLSLCQCGNGTQHCLLPLEKSWQGGHPLLLGGCRGMSLQLLLSSTVTLQPRPPVCPVPDLCSWTGTVLMSGY